MGHGCVVSNMQHSWNQWLHCQKKMEARWCHTVCGWPCSLHLSSSVVRWPKFPATDNAVNPTPIKKKKKKKSHGLPSRNTSRCWLTLCMYRKRPTNTVCIEECWLTLCVYRRMLTNCVYVCVCVCTDECVWVYRRMLTVCVCVQKNANSVCVCVCVQKNANTVCVCVHARTEECRLTLHCAYRRMLTNTLCVCTEECQLTLCTVLTEEC